MSSAVRLLAIGAATTVGQAVLLREGMAALGGSELAWGGVLAVWLAGMAAGAWAGAGADRRWLAWAGPVLVPVAVALATLVFRALPLLVGAGRGEAASSWRGLLGWLAAVALPAMIGGASFPAAARSDPATGAGRAYAVESAGAVLGGLAFTFVLAGMGPARTLILALVTLASVLLATAGHTRLAFLPLVALPAVGLADRTLASASWRWSGRAGVLAAWAETQEQRVELARLPEGAALYADGRLASPLEIDALARARVQTVVLAAARHERILALNAAADGTGSVLAALAGERLDLLDEDPGLVPFLRAAWPGFAARLTSPSSKVEVRLLAGDPLRVVHGGGPWDLIFLLDGDPDTLRANRTRTVEFFRACRAALSPRGALVVRTGVSDTFLGGSGGRLLATLHSTVSAVFPDVRALPGEQIWLLAASAPGALDLDPKAVLARAEGLRESAPHGLTLPFLQLVMDPERSRALAGWLGSAHAAVNRAAHPVAVLPAAMLREGRGLPPLVAVARAVEGASPGWLAAAVAVVAAVLLGRSVRRAPLGIEVAAVVGFCSMGWWLLLLACWQSRLGSVYAEVGALSAAFMAGTVAGAVWARKRAPAATRELVAVLGAGCALSLVMASGLALTFPRLVGVPALVLSGALTGAAFPFVAARAGSSDAREGIGRGFAADEMGAAAAALAVGLVVLPWAGLTAGALALAGLEAAACAALLVASRGRPR